jgi:predicted methyltransferase
MNRALLASALPLFVGLATVACGGSPAQPPASPAPASLAPAPPVDPATDAKIVQSLAGAQRTDAERARDVYRHPRETLAFFGLRENMTVVEIAPGGGWYTAVLAPVLREHGKLFVVGGDPAGDPKSEGTRDAQALMARIQKSPGTLDAVQAVVMRDPLSFGPPGSADMVLTFRNFHNWVGDPFEGKVLAAAFAVLKHGGVLGVTDHRAKADAARDTKAMSDTGYVPESFVVEQVEKAGFQLAGRAEINANPRDTKDYPKGVWTLPPSYELGDTDRAKYQAIGESDRMTLRFVKP